MDTELRSRALEVLQRLTPSSHYWLREYDPQADRELTTPLLREPSRFGMTAVEGSAARALDALAAWSIEYRSIHSEVFPAQDCGAERNTARLSEDQERELYGLRELFRCKALYFAQQVDDVALIGAYSTPTPAPSEAPSMSVPPVSGVAPAGKGLPKQQVMAAFADIHFTIDRWNKNLASPPDWLIDCRVALGSKKVSALWNPVLIAAALYDKGIALKRLDAVFVGLKDWSNEWREVSATFRD